MAHASELRATYRHGTLVIWPPDEVRRPVNVLRQRYDPTSQAVCEAHITLTQPFLNEPDEASWYAIADVLRAFEPFTIAFGPLRTFLPYPCIYLEIRPGEAVMRLRAALHVTGLFNLDLPFSDDSFIPHMSITDGYPDLRQTRLIAAALAGSEPRGDFFCDQVAYIQPDENFRFGVRRMLPLGGRDGND